LALGRGLTSAEIQLAAGRVQLGLQASMGPRTYIRGNGSANAFNGSTWYGLQWGRGLTSAEI